MKNLDSKEKKKVAKKEKKFADFSCIIYKDLLFIILFLQKKRKTFIYDENI